jgi:hypothetical protein
MLKIADKELNEIATRIYNLNEDATLWDVIVAYLSAKGNIEPCVIWILSDIQLLEMLARGYEVGYISQYLNISPYEIRRVAKIWGMYCMDSTLDFDPLVIYKEGMTVQDMKLKLNGVTTFCPEIFSLEKCFNNVEKYINIKNLLDKWEEKNG